MPWINGQYVYLNENNSAGSMYVDQHGNFVSHVDHRWTHPYDPYIGVGHGPNCVSPSEERRCEEERRRRREKGY